MHKLFLTTLVILSAIDSSWAADESRPNIVIFLADDQGWGDLSLTGNKNISTPNIDSLARDGASFEQFMVCPVCAPTRAEFLTGRYHPRGDVWGVSTGGERLNLDEQTLPEFFKKAGYATGAFGKWHNGTQYPYHPLGRGFDEYYGFTSGHWGSYFSPMLDHNGKITTGKGYLVDDLTNHAISFIKENKERPFICYLPYNVPHSPMQVPDNVYAKFKDKPITMRNRDPKKEDVEFTRAALAMCESIDDNVGRVLKTLDKLQLSDNTIVVYFSDNGPNSWRWNAGLRGKKGDTDEGGVRSPLLIRWPGHIASGLKVNPIASAIDLLPTLTGLVGIPLRTKKPIDGKSLVPLLMGSSTTMPERMIFNHWNGKVSVRTSQYRLDDQGRLYDMTVDPGQNKNISDEQPELAKKLRQAVADWKMEMQTDERKDDRPFLIGAERFPITQLPARDGRPHGKIKRSAQAPNCSFFTNWSNIDDTITWDVDVKTAGAYQVQLYYTAPKESVGSEVSIISGNAKQSFTIKEANEPPLTGKENDRVPRKGESYVKNFQPLDAGTIELSEGRQTLTLQATKITGRQVMDVRLLVLSLNE